MRFPCMRALASACALTVVTAAAVLSASPASAAVTNLALNKSATGSTACASTEGPEKAFNGSVSGGNSDKWCSQASAKWLQVDLGAAASISSFTVKHAGAGGESTSFNTKAFTIQLSSDGSTWSTAVTVTNNTASTTTHPITATNARYAKLNISTPTQTSDTAARIYEFEVYGESTTPPSSGCTATNGTDIAIPDLSTVESSITVSGCSGNASATSSVDVHIKHTYIGDLVVSLVAPDGSTYVLQNRAGGSADDINQTFTVNLSSETANGTWKLRVQDAASADTGTIDSWTLSLGSGSTPGGGTITVFDKIPQFGIYVGHEPNYTPPAGVLMWSYGTEFARKLSDSEKALIGDNLTMKLTYHAQCDNYDRFGNLFIISMPKGEVPTATTPRITLQDFITPFSDYWQGTKATYTLPGSDLGPYANAMANPDRDIYVGIKGGSNPYSGDACDAHSVTDPDFKAVGFKYSLSLVSTTALTAADRDIDAMLSASPEKTNNITAGPVSHTATSGRGKIALSIAGYGSSYPNGEEYSNTTMTVKLNDVQIGQFSTMIDCAPYEQYSPDGNPGIFHNNTTTNPRSWCPGALVPIRYFDTGDITGKSVTLNISFPRKTPFTDDSLYRTSLALLEK